MEQAPEQAPVTEQALREAAFERARRKLAAVRSDKLEANKASFWLSLPMRHAYRCLFYTGLAALLISTWSGSEPAETFASWRTINAAIYALAIGAAFWELLQVRHHWRHDDRHDPEAVLNDFYERVSDKKLHDQLYELVVVQDFGEAERTFPEWVDVSAAMQRRARLIPPFRRLRDAGERPDGSSDDSGQSTRADQSRDLRRPTAKPGLIEYWGRIVARPGNRVAKYEIGDLETVSVAPDLVLAEFELLESLHTERESWYSGVFAGAFGGMTFFLEKSLGEAPAFILVAVASFAAQFVPRFLPRRHSRSTRIRKLLVRTDHGWRLFSGDWQSQDEIEISWVDSGPPEPADARPEPVLAETS